MKDWKDKLGGFFRAKGQRPEDTAMQKQVQSTWNHFVTHQVLPAFQEIKSIYERHDGTTVDIQQAPAGEQWVRLTWMVAPSASMLAVLEPRARTAPPPRTVLTYTIIGDKQFVQTKAWCETRIPNKADGLTDSSRVFREALGDYRRKDLTKDTIQSNFLANYQRHVLGSGIRSRGGCLTVWLVVMSLLFGLLLVGVAIAIFLSSTSAFAPTLIITYILNALIAISVILGSVGLVGMWLWKTWGYYLLLVGFLVCIPLGLLDVAFGHDSPQVFFGELAFGVLGAILLSVVMRRHLVYFD